MPHPDRPLINDAVRKAKNQLFLVVCLLASSLVLVVLVFMLTTLVRQGGGHISWRFLTSYHHDDNPAASGILPAMAGSLVVCLICAAAAIPVGIGTAILMEEFRPKNRTVNWLHQLVQLNVNNLAGVPSIVYGILGVTAFVYMFNLFGVIEANKTPQFEMGARRYYQVRTIAKEYVWIPVQDKNERTIRIEQPCRALTVQGEPLELQVIERGAPPPSDPADLARTVYRGSVASIFNQHRFFYAHLPFGTSVLSAGLTLALVILPIVVISTQEAIRAVPGTLREAAFGLGTTRWQMVRTVVLPAALPGIMTGTILAMGRAIGEAAPLLAVMRGVISNSAAPANLMENSATLPVLIYGWAQDENKGFHDLSAAAILVLLVLLLLMNATAIFIRYRTEHNTRN